MEKFKVFHWLFINVFFSKETEMRSLCLELVRRRRQGVGVDTAPLLV